MVIKKIVAPSNLCVEPYLTQWYADLESGMQIWIQTNEDNKNPKWVRLGALYEASFYEDKHSDIIQDWIRSYDFPS